MELSGLSSAEVKSRLEQFGTNRLPLKLGDSALRIFIRQFNSVFVYVLLLAAAASYYLGQPIHSLYILTTLFLFVVINTWQKYFAHRAATAHLKKMPHFANVVRDGQITKIKTTNIVPDDMVILTAGDGIPADLELISCEHLLVNESSFTGEARTIAKSTIAAGDQKSASESSNQVFAGTLVTHGRGIGKVVATGKHSKYSQNAPRLRTHNSEIPPLLQHFEHITPLVSYYILIAVALLFGLFILRGASLINVFLLCVALAVSAIPQGLIASIYLNLAVGARRMARNNVFVRNLSALESLGKCTYIASGKSGVLTTNENTVKKIVLPSGDQFDVSGEGMDLQGEISKCEDKVKISALENLIRAGLLSNEASLSLQDDKWLAWGDSVDLAFLVLAAKYGLDHQRAKTLYPQIAHIPYENSSAFSASANQLTGEAVLHVKGSPERVLPMCNGTATGDPLDQQQFMQQVKALAGTGYRVLALACGHFNHGKAPIEQQLSDLTLLGLVGIKDPLRPGVITAMEHCREARIDVAMVTGDHPETALALARDLGIAAYDSHAVTGSDMRNAEAKGSEALQELIDSTHVFARVDATQKLQIVNQLIDGGHQVAVTAMGVSDAPALKPAHLGFATGNQGCEVARENSDLIIADDNFASAVNGFKYGRVFYKNIRKLVYFLLSFCVAQVGLFVLSMVFTTPLPLHPLQLLWLNLITFCFLDITLAFEPEELDELKNPPRPPGESIFNRLMIIRILVNATFMAGLAFLIFALLINQGFETADARNSTLLLMILIKSVHSLNSRSETLSLFKHRLFGNLLLIAGILATVGTHIGAMYTPILNTVLQIKPVTIVHGLSLAAITLLLIMVDGIQKNLHSHRKMKKYRIH